MSFYIAIICFLVSVSIGLLLLAAGQKISRQILSMLGLLHVMVLFAFLASLVLSKGGDAPNYFFLAFICSGVLISGPFARSAFPIYVRIYFGLFALTLPLFLFSPSMLVHFLLTMSYSSSFGPKFQLVGKYYLEAQNVIKEDETKPLYKLMLKRGLYKQTIERDIRFSGKLDSVKVLEVNGAHSMRIRGYSSENTYVSSTIDSLDVEVSLRKQKYGDVEYKI